MSSAEPHSAISYADATALVANYSADLRFTAAPEPVPLLEALGRVLAAPVLADREQPPFARSTRDGFACRAADLSDGRSLHVVGLLRAGQAWAGPPLAAGEAIEIMTGAPLPAGADCVVMVEHVVHSANPDTIALASGRSIAASDNYIPAGAEARAGATLVPAGTRLGPSHIAAAAAAGAATLMVHPRPRVAILSTGDELVSIDEQPQPFEIRNSNSYSLAAQVLALGGEPLIQPIARDTPEALEQAVRATLGCDLLLLSGGVSMGKYDLVEGVLAALGAQFFFTGVRIQPGKPVVFGDMPGDAAGRRLPFFGLPGNPVSTMVTFALFAAPILAALGGEQGYSPRFAEARLAVELEPRPKLRRFLPGRLSETSTASIEVTPVSWQGSGDIAGTAQANCLLVVPELEPDSATETLPAGTTVRVLLLS